MAILAIVTEPRINKERYEQLRREVDWEHRQPEGMIFHAAAFDASGGLHVSDVWTTKEAMDDFFEKRLLPAMRKLKIPEPGTRDIYTMHAGAAYSSIDQFRIRQLAR